MAEYIEREKVVTRVLGLTIVDPMVAQYADAVLWQIQQAPTIDAVPVVRCKDCKHYSEDAEHCFYIGVNTDGTGFCSWANGEG